MPAMAVDHEHRVTPRELFFDLVFVFAFTQVATLLANDATWAGIGRGVLVLAALWWPWTAYAWLTNTVDPEEGVVGAALLVALIAMFVAALAVPGAFDDEGVLFGAAILVVVTMHLALYALAGRGNPDLLRAVLRLAPWTLLGSVLILVAGFTDTARTWLWLAALASTYVGAALSGSTGWRVHPSHLAERYGLVVIIALGEAFISIGVGATATHIGVREIAAAILGLLVATSFWLAYFDFFSIRGERLLADLRGPERIAFARDVYAYAHLPMIVGDRPLRVRDEAHRRARRRRARLRQGLRALRWVRRLPADVLGDPVPHRAAPQPRSLYRRAFCSWSWCRSRRWFRHSRRSRS